MQMVSRKEFEGITEKWLADVGDVFNVTAANVGKFLDAKVSAGEIHSDEAAKCKAEFRQRADNALAVARDELAQATARYFPGKQIQPEE